MNDRGWGILFGIYYFLLMTIPLGLWKLVEISRNIIMAESTFTPELPMTPAKHPPRIWISKDSWDGWSEEALFSYEGSPYEELPFACVVLVDPKSDSQIAYVPESLLREARAKAFEEAAEILHKCVTHFDDFESPERLSLYTDLFRKKAREERK